MTAMTNGLCDINAVMQSASCPALTVEFAQQDENGKWVLPQPQRADQWSQLIHWRNELGILGGTAVFHGSHLQTPPPHCCWRYRVWYGPHPIGPDMDRHYYPAFDFSSNLLVNAEYPEGLIALQTSL